MNDFKQSSQVQLAVDSSLVLTPSPVPKSFSKKAAFLLSATLVTIGTTIAVLQ